MKKLIRKYRFIGDDEPETFTQEQVNAFMKKDKEKNAAAFAQMETDLATVKNQNEELSKTSKLDEQQLAQFRTETEEMRQRGLSDADKWAEEKAGLQNVNKALELSGKTETDKFKGLYESNLTKQALNAACSRCETHTGVTNPEHMIAILQARSQVDQESGVVSIKDFLVPVKDSKTGEFEKKDVSPAEAITIMSQQDIHKNLFNLKGKKGTGDQSSEQNGPKIANEEGPQTDSIEDTRKWLQENRKQEYTGT